MYRIKFKDGREEEFECLKGKDLRRADLRYANLRYADLSDADLSRADLSFADLRGANLRYADLSDANLRGVNLSRADLSFCKGIITFQFQKHFAIYFKYNNIYYLKIGCTCLEVNVWIQDFELIGERENYSKNEIEVYGAFIKLCSMYEIV